MKLILAFSYRDLYLATKLETGNTKCNTIMLQIEFNCPNIITESAYAMDFPNCVVVLFYTVIP